MKNIVKKLSRVGREGQVPMPATSVGHGAGQRAARGLGAGWATELRLPGGSAPGGRQGRRAAARLRAERGAPPGVSSLN